MLNIQYAFCHALIAECLLECLSVLFDGQAHGLINRWAGKIFGIFAVQNVLERHGLAFGNELGGYRHVGIEWIVFRVAVARADEHDAQS